MTHEVRNYPWPKENDEQKTPQSTAIIAVNYNTRELIIQLIWSIYHNLKADGFAKLLVVDNNSSDGSQQILRGLAEESLIEYIENKENLYHGPALNQAFDYLSERQMKNNENNINAIWILDSDCVVLRPETLVKATKIMNQTHAALVGQKIADQWNKGLFGLHSLLVDPAQIWRDPITPFEEHGQPSLHLQESCIQAGLTLTPFNFTAESYVIHLGRSSLAAVAKKNETDNRYFDWAKEHFEPHFAGEEHAKENYEAFFKQFNQAVPDLGVDTVVRAIKKQTQG